MKKFVWFLVGAVSMVSFTALAATFTDSGSFADWYAEPVANLSDMGVIEGYPDGSFQPGNNVNRAELAVMMNRLHDQILAEVNDSTAENVGEPGDQPNGVSEDALSIDQFILLLNWYDELSGEDMLSIVRTSLVMAMGGYNELDMDPDVFGGAYTEYVYAPEVGPAYNVYYSETGDETYVSIESINEADESYFEWYGPYNFPGGI